MDKPDNQVLENMEQSTIWDVAYPRMPEEVNTVNYEFFRYENAGSSVKHSRQYRLWSTDQNSFYYLPSAHIQVDFNILDNNGANVTKEQQTALASNGWCLFKDIRVRFQDVQVAHIDKPGKMSQMRNVVEAGKDYIETVGQSSHYFVDKVSDKGVAMAYVPPAVSGDTLGNGDVPADGISPKSFYHETQYKAIDDNAGNNSFLVSAYKNPQFDESFKQKIDMAADLPPGTSQKVFLPLRDICPIFDIDKVVRGTKIEVELNKIGNPAEALFGATDNCTIQINRVQLWLARVRPSVKAMARLSAQVAADPVVEHHFENLQFYSLPYSQPNAGEHRWSIVHKSNRPTRVVVGFQVAGRDTDIKLNPLQFDTLQDKLTRVELRANGVQVPTVVYQPNYDSTRIIHDLHKTAYKLGDTADSAIITKKNWNNMYPLFAFDLEKLSSAPYESRSHTTLDFVWSLETGFAAGYNVVALVYSDGSGFLDQSSGITQIRTV